MVVGFVVDYHHGQIDLDRDHGLVVIDQMVDHLAWLGNVIETYLFSNRNCLLFNNVGKQRISEIVIMLVI